MEPTIEAGSTILVETSYPTPMFEPGDVVVVRRGVEHDVKRIIGVPGQTVGYETGWLTLDGEREVWVGGNFPFKDPLDEDEFFMVGDNLAASIDSRVLDPIRDELIRGKVRQCDAGNPGEAMSDWARE